MFQSKRKEPSLLILYTILEKKAENDYTLSKLDTYVQMKQGLHEDQGNSDNHFTGMPL